MASIINASSSGSGGIVQTADASGVLQLQSNGTTQATISSTGLALGTGTTINAANTFGFKNRLINGGMGIDQRNAGASYTATTGGLRYGVDRFFIYCTGANLTGQQVAGTNTGTQKAFRITGATGSTLCNFAQRIEATNIYDTASATVTISVKVYCSTSISGVSIYVLNPTATDNYASTTTAISTGITLNSGLNTITVSGTNGANGIYGAEVGLAFSSGIGNGVSVDVGNFQIELGSQATSFDFRSYGTELALCQRYFETLTSVGGSSIYVNFLNGGANSATQARYVYNYQVQKRSYPSVTFTTASGFSTQKGDDSLTTCTALVSEHLGINSCQVTTTVASGLTAGATSRLISNGVSTAVISCSAEL